MAQTHLHPDAHRFIVTYITSVAQLEMLLLLRNRPDHSWTEEDLSRELRVEAGWAKSQLRILCDDGLLECCEQPVPTYRYAPRDQSMNQAATAVAQAYLLHRVSVIELIYSRSNPNIQAFSDAFKLRRDPDNG